jgi:DNA-directed RNA polymerase subunit RPC12/RpoP
MEPLSFFESWNHYMQLGGLACLGLAFLILLYHEYRILQIKDYKEKYDYVNLNEIQFFWYTVLMVIIAGAFFGNTIATERIIHRGMLWFWVRLFITVSFATIAYFIFYSMVRIYYPRFVEKRLVKLRNRPRISPAGNYMRKLSEEEEDTYLDASQIAEEASAIHSVDYDVWIDEKSGYKKIEKYMNYQHAEECPNCGYVTLKIDREEIETPATTTEVGVLAKYYRCEYCNHRLVKHVTLGKLMETPTP